MCFVTTPKVKVFPACPAKVCQILCSPRSRDFWHSPLRYASLLFIPICFPLFDVCDVCFWSYLHFPHQIIYFLCPVLIPDCRPRVCVNVYIFSYGFISTAPIAMATENIFWLPNMCRYFLLNPIIFKPCCCTRILWNPGREIKPYIIY